MFLPKLDLKNFKTSIESEGTSNNNYLGLHDRNSDIIIDDINGSILRECCHDPSANNSHPQDISFGLVLRFVPTRSSVVFLHKTIVRSLRRIRSVDDTVGRPVSPDNNYPLDTND
jgi:hypothetical protein